MTDGVHSRTSSVCARSSAQNVTASWRDVSLPLKGVCEAQSRSHLGVLIFICVTVVSLGGVIFGTSRQSLSGLMQEFRVPEERLRRSAVSDRADRMHGKCCLFISYLLITLVLMLFFTFTPFTKYDGTRDDSGWRDACDNNDVAVLDLYGLS